MSKIRDGFEKYYMSIDQESQEMYFDKKENGRYIREELELLKVFYEAGVKHTISKAISINEKFKKENDIPIVRGVIGAIDVELLKLTT